MLLEWGGDVNIVGKYHGTALQVASYEGKMESVQLLLEWGANVNIHGCHIDLLSLQHQLRGTGQLLGYSLNGELMLTYMASIVVNLAHYMVLLSMLH